MNSYWIGNSRCLLGSAAVVFEETRPPPQPRPLYIALVTGSTRQRRRIRDIWPFVNLIRWEKLTERRSTHVESLISFLPFRRRNWEEKIVIRATARGRMTHATKFHPRCSLLAATFGSTRRQVPAAPLTSRHSRGHCALSLSLPQTLGPSFRPKRTEGGRLRQRR